MTTHWLIYRNPITKYWSVRDSEHRQTVRIFLTGAEAIRTFGCGGK